MILCFKIPVSQLPTDDMAFNCSAFCSPATNRLIAAGTSQPDVVRAQLYLSTGRRAEGEKIIREQIAKYKEGDNCWPIALHAVRLGEIDKAFEFLERSYQRHESLLRS